MTQIFNVLYAVHPLAPIVYLAMLANGLFAPALYGAFTKTAFDLRVIRHRASEGDEWAKYVYLSWLLLAIFSAILVILVLGARLV